LSSHKLRRNELQTAVDRCQRSLADFQNARAFRENFTPDQEIPSAMSNAAEEIYAKHFQNSGCVKSEGLLARLSTEFHAFWKKHGDAYQRLHAAGEKAREAKVTKNRKAAPKGLASRERARWLKQTQGFVTFLNANQSRQSDRSELIENYAAQHCAVSSKPAKIKVREFLGMLSSYEHLEFDDRTILEILRKIGIKALNTDAVRECLTLMKSASGKGRGKKSKKSL
jgi:hypothetical protein